MPEQNTATTRTRSADVPAGSEHPAAGASIASDPDTAVIEVRVYGQWSPHLAVEVRTALQKCLVQHPPAIIIDLSGMSDLDAASTGTWLAANRACGAPDPPTHVVLCVPPTRRLASYLRQVGAARLMPICATMNQARDTVASRLAPLYRQHLRRLRHRAAAAGTTADAVMALARHAW